MGCDGFLQDRYVTPSIWYVCYECSQPVTDRPDNQHRKCLQPDGSLRVQVEHDEQYEVR